MEADLVLEPLTRRSSVTNNTRMAALRLSGCAMNVREAVHYRVTAALITAHGRLFIAQRPPNKKFGLCWEFPGGKVDLDESLQHCLQREIREELNWEIHVGELFEHIHHEQDAFRIDLFAFWSGVCGGRLELREHVACDWVSIPALHHYAFTEADRLLIERLEQLPALPDSTTLTTLDSREIYGICDPRGESPKAECSHPPTEKL
jgi:8-oxo-dGTP diphosphatase